MPGYNHYPDCACGWCVNYGRTSISPGDFSRALRQHDAKVFLARHAANSIAGCYVTPNAKCPVCKAPVYFYANSHGSRVFFDDLGPPWPKHPCTDRATQSATTNQSYSPPERRNRGLVQELLSAAQTAGLTRLTSSGESTHAWQLHVITSINRFGTNNRVTADCLTALHTHAITFTCRSDVPVFDVGDFIHRRGNVFSFLHRETMVPREFKEGGVISFPVAASEPLLPAVPPAPIIRQRQSARAQGTTRPPEPRGDLTSGEMKHFHSAQINVAELCSRLEPTIKAYARQGTRKPRDVAPRLNQDGHRTAIGSQWTPRLVFFLLKLIFNNPPEPERQSHRHNSSTTTASPLTHATFTKDEIARRLEALGRVSIRPADGHGS